MSKIPTAEEFLLQNNDKDFRLSMSGLNVSDVMIEFAKLHVEAALKEASKKSTILENDKDIGSKYTWDAYNTSNRDIDYEVNKDSILNAYPLKNIK